MALSAKKILHSYMTMTIPITSADSGHPLHIDVGTVPGEPGGEPVRGSE